MLLVDDEPDARSFLSSVLQSCGAQTLAVSSAREALMAVQTWNPSVLPSDIGMPHEDGYALIRQVRMLAPERGGCLPAAALTAYVRDEERVRALAEGFQFHLPKPVTPRELVSVVMNLSGRAE